jgi:hypothetical protein
MQLVRLDRDFDLAYPPSMRILFVADGRSPIALNWIGYFVQAGHEVHLASTFICSPDLKLASLQVIPVAFSGLKGNSSQGIRKTRGGVWSAGLLPLRTKLRQWLGPLTLGGAGKRLAYAIHQVQPEVIQAMRIPYEGMLAREAKKRLGTACPPLLVSIWGNDFTLHAPSTPWMAYLTGATLGMADALHTDCQRDLRLAADWGFNRTKPSIVLPGAGGVQKEIFYPPENESERGEPMVIQPRGFRAYIRNEAFFRAIPRVLEQVPAARFICPTMQGETQAERWLEAYAIRSAVRLLPAVARSEMANLFRQAQVAISPSTHDGTPNTLLEAMACGCFPVAGDLESLREWIEPGVNGLLVDPNDPEALARAMVESLQRPDLRQRAQEINARLVRERADYGQVMSRAERFISEILR